MIKGKPWEELQIKDDFLFAKVMRDKEIHKICGSKSGRDMDKVKATGLSPLFTENGSITFEQARLTFECKKLYADLIKPGNFIDKSITDRWYGESHGGFHKMYVVEIVNVLSR